MSDPDTIDLTIRSKFDAAGTKQAQDALKGLTAAQRQASADAARSAQDQAKIQQATARTAAAQAQAATQAQRLATEQQRTANASNTAATAAQRLSTEQQKTAATAARAAAEQQNVAKASAQAAAAQDRQALAALRLSQAQAKAAQGGGPSSFAGQVGQELGNQVMGAVGPAALAAVAVEAAKGTIALTQEGAAAELTRKRFDDLARAGGTTGEALLSALRAASGGEINDLNLELAANRAQLLGVANSAEQFSTLMAIARDRAQQMGISTSQAFNDLVTGLGRGSALILDNLGITISVTEANKAYAAQLGVNVSALTEAQQKTALINAVLSQGKASLDATGGAAESNAGKIQKLGAMWDNFKTSVGAGIADTVSPELDLITGSGKNTHQTLLSVVDALTQTTHATEATAAATHEGAAAFLDWLGITDTVPATTSAADQAQQAHEATVQALAKAFADGKISLDDYDRGIAQLNATTPEAIAQHQELAAQEAEATKYAHALSDAVRDLAQSGPIGQSGMFAAAVGVDAVAQSAAEANRQLAYMNVLLGKNSQQAAIGARDGSVASGQRGSRAASFGLAAAQAVAAPALLGRMTATGASAAAPDKARRGAASKAEAEARKLDAAQEKAQDILNKQADYEEELARKREKAAQDRDDKLASIAKDEGERLAEIQKDSATKLDELNQSTAKKREDLEKSTSDKLRSIRSKLAGDLAAIDARAAQEQENAARGLGESIASSLASANVANAADNLDLAGSGADPALQQREAAQAARLQALQAAGARAQSFGDASVGAASFAADQQMIQQRAQLDEAYAQKQQELAGNPQALQELDAYYQQAIAAEQAYVAQQVAAAQQEAEVKAAQIEQEKEQARAAAEAERKAVMAEKAQQTKEIAAEAEAQRAKIEEEAQKQHDAAVQKAAEARDEVGKAFEDQQKTIDTWASDTETDIQRVIDKLDGLEASAYKAAKAMKSVPSGGSAASGGSAPTGAAAAPDAPHRAAGGPVQAGQLYNINERGIPEYFVPDQSGMIYPLMPNASALGGGAMSITFAPGAIVVNAAPNMDTGALAAQAADLTYKRFKAELSRRSM